MRFPSEALVPSGGEIYCHVFENRLTGLARALFWSITIEFEPLEYGDDWFCCSLTCEWIPWPLRNWRELDGLQLDADYGENGIESSFYLVEHDLATHTKLSLRHRRENLFAVDVDMLVDFRGYYGGDENDAMPVRAEATVPFIGLLITCDSLLPKPSMPSDVRNVTSAFIDLSAYEAPEPWQVDGFIFRPAPADPTSGMRA